MKVDKYIFREGDIRGVVGVGPESGTIEKYLKQEYEKWYGPFPGITINLKVSEAVGKAYGTFIKRLGGKEVVVGYEVRPHADELKKAFIGGVLATGISVVDIGKTTTPLVYFLTAYQNFDGGVNITGSHNIYFFNGFKLTKKDSAPLYGEELQKLYRMIIEDDFDLASKGRVRKVADAYGIYKKYLLDRFCLGRKLAIVIDCGNGTPGLFARDFFQSLGCNVVQGLYFEPNAYFPNHVPDPEMPYNLKDLSQAVREKKADVGIAFDADGDRVGFVDEKGEFVFADEILLLLAKDILAGNKGKKILFDVKCSQLLFELLPKFGGVPLMHKTGHGSIKDTLRKNPNIILGGEISGHFYFVKDYFKIDDGFFAAAKVLELLSRFDGPFSSMFSFIPQRVRTPEIKLPCADEAKFKVVEQITEEFAKKYKVITVDGARVMFGKQCWGLIRASDTAPCLTIRVEALTAEKALEIKNILADVLEKHPEIKDKLDRKRVYSLTGKLGYL